jgi:hypothetical protein
LKGILPFWDGNTRVNQLRTMLGKPMKGAGNTGFGVVSHLAEKIVDGQKELGLLILLSPF